MIESFWSAAAAQSFSNQSLGQIKKVEQAGQVILLHDVNARLEVTVISENIVRMRVAPHGTFLPDFSYARKESEFNALNPNWAEEEDHFALLLPDFTLEISKEDMATRFVTTAGLVLAEDLAGPNWEDNTEFGGQYVHWQRAIAPNECFYGLGDKASDLNLAGHRFTLWSTDAYAFERNTDPLYRNIPFYMGLNQGVAYGIFFDNTYRTHFDFGTGGTGKLTYTAEGGELCCYYIHGPHMMDVVKRYSHLTGSHPMPPLWALGYHQCKWSYFPEATVKEIAAGFRKHQIPCDAIYLDIDYMDAYKCFTWDLEKFPNPAGMMKELAADGFKTVVILDPGIKIDPEYDVFNEGVAKGYFCRRGDDYWMEGPVWPGRCQFPDFTNPEVRTWWGDKLEALLDEGVAGIWTDMNEPSVFGTGTFPNDVRHNYEGYRGSHRKAHNVYGMQMARATYEGLRRHRPRRRPFVITRSCYSGVQRYASCWTGDNIGTWDHLRLANVQCQRMSMSGISFVGTDIGGFTGNPDGELFARWVQLATFHPLMRGHYAGDTRAREPWQFGEPFTSICRKFIELRYRLLPYIYSVFWENCRYGFPMLRPIVMMEQGEFNNSWRQDEFTFGDKILVCPVLVQGVPARRQMVLHGPPRDFGRWGRK
jgi:alpha-glucosidase